MPIKNYHRILLIMIVISLSSCKKFLDAKPDQSLNTGSLEGFQGFLDSYDVMNMQCSPATGIASDNYYLTDVLYDALQDDFYRKGYLWNKDVFAGVAYSDWQNEYNIVYKANLVLDGLSKIERVNRNAAAWDYCKGSALVYRAKAFFEIAQVWAPAYNNTTAKDELGIPLRLTSDFNVPSVRASNEDTYDRIIKDLKASIPCLSDVADNVFRPSKAAAYGLLSRTFLAMRNYPQSKIYADSCLAINDRLLDFNQLDVTSSSPFGPVLYTNPEDIMHSTAWLPTGIVLAYIHGRIDSLLYRSYDENDLRKKAYFLTNADGSHGFKSAYGDANQLYNGLATDEVYLNRAECLVRQGNIADGMHDLNKLLLNRYKTGSYIPYTITDPEEALKLVLQERRKELFYRMLRFTDIKRLNKEGKDITLKRIIHGKTYILKPNDPAFARPIPEKIIELSGIQQNKE